MSFPLSPTNGQSTTVNGVEYTYNSTKAAWLKTTAGSGTVPATVSSTLTVAGNITANSNLIVVGNITGSGTADVTGNANVGNLGTSGLIVATGNITGGNLTTAGVLSVTGNANVGNLGTATAIITTGNITTINSGLLQNGNSNISIDANSHVRISANGTANIVYVAANGNVGIGTSTPGSKLEVNGNVSLSAANSYLTLSEVSGAVSSAPAGDVAIYSRAVGGRYMLGLVGPTGLDVVLNPHFGRNRVKYLAAVGNAVTVPDVFPGTQAFTAVGTATARNWASTNILTRATRLGYVSAATAGQLASLRWTVAQFSTGNGSGLGGFHYIVRFGTSDASAVAGARMFVGVSSATGAATNVEPNTLTNSIGVAKLAADTTQWYIVYGGSAAQTNIALGTGLGSPNDLTTIYELALFASPGQNGVVSYQVTNVGTGVSVSGTLTPATPGTQTPASTTALVPQIWRTNNATAAAVGIDFISLYLETDD